MGCCKVCVNNPPDCDVPIIQQIFSVILILLAVFAAGYIALYGYLVSVVQNKIKKGIYSRQ
jgi:hypothetical protein